MRRLYLATLCLILCLIPSWAWAQGKILCYTTWDDFYFYAAFQVDDSDVTGKNTAPNSKPWEDDCIEVFLEADNKHASNRTQSTCSMVVSSAGGSGFTVGEKGKALQVPVVIYKYSQVVQGTLNDSDDVDVGYQVEMAIPWQLIRIVPKPGTMMSFNVVCRMKGERSELISLSPEVKTEADIQNPSKWANVVLSAPTFGAATLDLKKIVCSRYVTKRPTIDGKIGSAEYNKNTSFEIKAPEAPAELAKKRPKRSLQRLIFARYLYDYQADPRKSTPAANVRNQDGSCLLTDYPAFAAGPWFSFERVEWQKRELADMRKAGVDAVLPVYRGDKKSQADYALKGLDCMVQAISELKAENKEYPLVGLYFDSSCLPAALEGSSDLKPEKAKAAFYEMLRDFFRRIPAEYRVQVNIIDDRAGYPTYVVFMGPGSGLTGCDDSLIDYVNKRFTVDFGGRLAWVFPSDFKGKAEKTDGLCSYPAGMGIKFDDTQLIRMAAVGPGYDNSIIAETPSIRGRNSGQVYKTDWSTAESKRPNWILIDSWNDFKQGSEVCGSGQYGFTYADLTTLSIGKMRGTREYDTKVLRHDTPRTIEPGKFYQVHLLVRNDGTQPLAVRGGFAVGYKWFKDGRPVEEGLVKRPIQNDILPGKTGEITLGLSAVSKDNSPLPEGEYEVYFEFIRLTDNKWLTALGDDPFIIPVVIGKTKEITASFSSADAPTMMKSGASYPVRVKVRNDGSLVWTKDRFQIGCRLWKGPNFGFEGTSQPADATPLMLALPKDVAPGEEIELEGLFAAKDSQGQPLPVWNPAEGWSYVMRWELLDGTNWLNDAGHYKSAVGVYSSDTSPEFIASDTPQNMDAGKEYTIKLIVRNRSAEPWMPKTHKIGYHWYYLDGTEALWDSPLAEFKKPVQPAKLPGDVEFVNIKVIAPPNNGQYILTWDLKEGDNWASTGPVNRGGDMLTAFVEVNKGRLSFVDLSKLFDISASSTDTDRSAGSFDGQGNSFPAEFLPPDVPASKLVSSVYPSGYYRSAAQAGADSQRRISFSYASDDAGQKNAVVCEGQAVEVTQGNYAALHILGAAIEPDAKDKIGFTYGTETGQADVTMSVWTDGPKQGEMTGFQSLHIHGKDGDVAKSKGYLYHYVIKLDPSKKLTGLTLPNNPKMRVVALTLEKAK